MAQLSVRNLIYILQVDHKLGQTLQDIIGGINSLADQVVGNPSGTVESPPTVSQLSVVANGGIFDLSIFDNNPVQRGINYFVEYSTTTQFSAPIVVDLGTSRNYRAFWGNQTLYFRAYSQYPTSAPSSPVYFGTAINPTPVVGGGSTAGPTPLPSTGSGTAKSDGSQGGSGFGKVGQRS